MSSNCNVRFMDNSFLSTDMVTDGYVTFSSESSPNVGANLITEERSLTWKPSGFFNIVEGVNDELNTNKGLATIVSGGYATADLLATAIETALNTDTSSTDWVVSYENYRFKIKNTVLNDAEMNYTVNSIMDTIGFTNQVNSYFFVADVFISSDKPRIHTSEYVDIDFSTSRQVDFIGMIGPTYLPFAIPKSATLTIKANNIPLFDSPQFEKVATVNDNGVMEFIDDNDFTQYRYWRMEIVDRENMNGPSSTEIGYLYMGGYFTFQVSNINNGFSKQTVDPSAVVRSVDGQAYFLKKNKYQKFTNLKVNLTDLDDRNKFEQIFFDKGLYTPLFVSLDPTLFFSQSIDELTKYVYFDDSPSYPHVIRDRYNITFNLREAL